MKKLLALILALVLVFALTACGTGTGNDDKTDDTKKTDAEKPDDTKTGGDKPDDTGKPDDAEKPDDTDDTEKTAGPTGLTAAEGMGFYHADYDYFANPTYKVVGMFASVSAMYQGHIDMYQVWAKLSNCEYTTYDSNQDQDGFCAAIETYAGQGYDGFINQGDTTIVGRITELFEEHNCNYMSGFSPNQDSDGKYTHPYVGVDNYGWGGQMVEWLDQYAKDTWEDYSTENTRMVWVDFSTSPLLHLRGIGSYNKWIELYPDAADSFMVLDCVSEGAFTEEAGYNLLSSAYAANPDVKYWLVTTCVEAPAMGCASAADSYGKIDTTCIVNAGGDSLIAQWDVGVETAYRAALVLPPSTYSEPFWFGLYAFMNGDATPETIWPEYQTDSLDGYAYLPVYSPIVGYGEYQNFFAWSDAHYGWTGTELQQYPLYTYDGVTEYPTLQEPGEAPIMSVTDDPLR